MITDGRVDVGGGELGLAGFVVVVSESQSLQGLEVAHHRSLVNLIRSFSLLVLRSLMTIFVAVPQGVG